MLHERYLVVCVTGLMATYNVLNIPFKDILEINVHFHAHDTDVVVVVPRAAWVGNAPPRGAQVGPHDVRVVAGEAKVSVARAAVGLNARDAQRGVAVLAVLQTHQENLLLARPAVNEIKKKGEVLLKKLKKIGRKKGGKSEDINSIIRCPYLQ
jgi:hypothetical protein